MGSGSGLGPRSSMPRTGRTPSSARSCGGQRRAASARRAMVASCASSPPTSSRNRLCSWAATARVARRHRVARLSMPISSGATSTSPRQSSPSLAGRRARPAYMCHVPLPSYSEGTCGRQCTTCSMATRCPALRSTRAAPAQQAGLPPALIERDISSIGASSFRLPRTAAAADLQLADERLRESTEPDG